MLDFIVIQLKAKVSEEDMEMLQSFVRVKEAAKRRGVSHQRIHQLINSGKIKTLECGAYLWVWQPLTESSETPQKQETAEISQGQGERLSVASWLERFKDRLEYELTELDEHGIRYELDQDAFKRGAIVLKFWFPIDISDTISLLADYPGTYLDTRFLVKTSELELNQDLVSFEKKISRNELATKNRNTDNILYRVLRDKLSDLLREGLSRIQKKFKRGKNS